MCEDATGLRFLEAGGDLEFDWFRRPGIVRASSGRMLACYEGRSEKGEPYQALFTRITDDAGANWSDRIPIARSRPGQMLHNIVPAFFSGAFHLFWNDNYRALFHASSEDAIQWSEPENLTERLRAARTEYPWDGFGIGSAHALTLSNGRVLIPTWFTTGGNTHKPSAFANIYSDDGFRTIGIGAMLLPDARVLNPNEGAIVELADGHVLATVRHDSDPRMRLMSRSARGVGPWSEGVFRDDLPDPICHASLVRLSWPEEGRPGELLFCNCANADEGALEKKAKGLIRYNWSDDARKDLTVRVSLDEGVAFSSGTRIAKKGGYSDMAATMDGRTVVVIFETGWDDDSCIFPRQLACAVLDRETIV